MKVELEMNRVGDLYCKTQGLWFKVRALIAKDEHVNMFLEHNTDCGVLTHNGRFAIVARLVDVGIPNLPQN